MTLKVEQVFKRSGIPDYTFVQPARYAQLMVSIRTPGRGLIVEGPSGIGKTTAVRKALEELGKPARFLSARVRTDEQQIDELASTGLEGTVVIDDFHKLKQSTRDALADLLKVIADEERADAKLVLIGINRAGESLLDFAPDLGGRIDTIKVHREPDSSIEELVTLGEIALNVQFNTKSEIVESAVGSFSLAQSLCFETCMYAGVLEQRTTHHAVETSHQLVVEQVMDALDRKFLGVARQFAQGPQLRPAGRAPYLRVLRWLGRSSEWTIALNEELSLHPDEREGVEYIVKKGSLAKFLDRTTASHEQDLGRVLHYDRRSTVLAIEDPQFAFFLRNLAWNHFAKKVGFNRTDFNGRRYDIALSFSGADRPLAETLFHRLAREYELAVFYDKNEQHRILASDVEAYLGPIYRTEAAYVVAVMGPTYPDRVWTSFESRQFKDRFGEGRVIPVWFSNSRPTLFDPTRAVGALFFDPTRAVDPQVRQIAATIARKIAESE